MDLQDSLTKYPDYTFLHSKNISDIINESCRWGNQIRDWFRNFRQRFLVCNGGQLVDGSTEVRV